MQATKSQSNASAATTAQKFTREELEKKVALCYFNRRVTMDELDHMSASMEKEDFEELWEMCGQAYEMGPRD